MLTSGCVLRCVRAGMRGRTESRELQKQLCLLHSASGHFTRSKWISRTVDPITSAVTRHWANQLVHRTMASFGPPTKLECVQVSAHGPFLAPKYIYPNTRGETWARKAYLKLKIIFIVFPALFTRHTAVRSPWWGSVCKQTHICTEGSCHIQPC